jgi:5-methylcytosine-specific restriction endonuclease McrA
MPYKDKEKQRQYQREYVAKNRAAFLDGKSCVECGSVENLEVDHIDPSLKVSHNVWSWAPKRRNEELEKCQVLCNTCHKAKTREMLYKGHGCEQRYREGCRCLPCKAAHSERARVYRAGLKVS